MTTCDFGTNASPNIFLNKTKTRYLTKLAKKSVPCSVDQLCPRELMQSSLSQLLDAEWLKCI